MCLAQIAYQFYLYPYVFTYVQLPSHLNSVFIGTLGTLSPFRQLEEKAINEVSQTSKRQIFASFHVSIRKCVVYPVISDSRTLSTFGKLR